MLNNWCALVSPVIVADLVIKFLFEFRVLRKVLVCCHRDDLFLRVQTRY
jgi:hypothetical protein